jgi:hypothetical protein
LVIELNNIKICVEMTVNRIRVTESNEKSHLNTTLGVDRARFKGGLALLWSNKVSIKIRSYSPSHIDAEILPTEGANWRFTGFYGNPDHHRRMEPRDLLRRLGNESLLPWMICEDFNEIVDNGEKLGFRSRPQRQMRIFRDVLSDCRLEDLGY